MPTLSGSGIRVVLPPGWEGEIDPGRTLADGAVRHSLTHVANFPLPPDRGDYGQGAVDLMRPGDAYVILLEFGPESLGTPLFRPSGLPRSLLAREFGRDSLQKPIEGQGGLQRFFTEAGRPFCLYVVVGSFIDRADVLPAINRVLAAFEVSP